MKKVFLLTSLFMMGFVSLFEAASKPTLSKLYGTPYTEEILQYNDAGTQGTLDDSFGTDGSLDLDEANFQARAIQVLDDGTFIVAMSHPSTNSILKKYSAEGSVITSFGSDGTVDLGSETIVPVQSMMIDRQGEILVGGGGDNSTVDGWLKRVSADGNTVETFIDGAPWSFIGGISQQTTGKFIVVGYNGINAQIGRYNLDGTLDTSGTLGIGFGTTGLIVFDGTNSLLSTQGLYSTFIDDYDYIFVTYLEGTEAKVIDFDENGALDEEYWPGVISISYLDGCIAETMHLAIDTDYYNVIVGASVDGEGVKLTSVDYDNGEPGSFAESTITDFNYLLEIIPTVDTKVLLIGFKAVESNHDMAVMRLTEDGVLDTSTANDNIPFNTVGYSLFHIGDSITSALLYAGSIAPNGQLFVAGFELGGSGQTPYVSRLYNAPFVSIVPQNPITSEQGSLDLTFGTNSTQSFRGIQMPYNGFFGGGLLQKPETVVELASLKFLIGSNGYTGYEPANKTMMLTRLTKSGNFDTSFGSGTGKLVLPNVSTSHETLAALAEDSSGIIYIAGTNGTPLPFLRSYTSSGAAISSDLVDTGIASVGIAIQGSFGILLFSRDDSTTGHISRYTKSSGTLSLDESFGTTGKVATDDFGLNMGPVHGGGLVNQLKNIIIAYKNSSTNAIDVAMINQGGNALITEFGTDGIVSNVFSDTSIIASNVQIAFDTNDSENIYIAAVSANGLSYIITRLNGTTGLFDTSFNSGSVLTVSPESVVTVLALTNITGMSNGKVMLTGYDAATNPVMLTLRVLADGSGLDTTFNSEGIVPGVVPIQIEKETANYYTRIPTGLAIQSSTSTTGNLVYSAYEQQIDSQATPEVMRLLGEAHTTQTQRFPIVDQDPGAFDVTYGTAGIATNYANGETLPAAGQQARAIQPLTTGTKILTIIGDGINSWTLQLLSDGTNDSSYGSGEGISIEKSTSGNETVQGAVFDGLGNTIVFGSNSTQGGYVKSLLSSGSMNPAFGGSGIDPIGITYDSQFSIINGVAQLSNGKYVIIGSRNGVGKLAMLTSFGIIDPSFTVKLFGTNIGSVSIDDLDNIYISYASVASNVISVNVAKLDVQGSVVPDYGIVTDIMTNLNSSENIRSALDIDGKIIVAASGNGSSGSVGLRRLNTNGTIDSLFNNGFQFNIPFDSGTDAVVTSLTALQNGSYYVAGYQYDPIDGDNNDYEFVATITNIGSFDSDFNASGDVPGLFTFQVATGQQTGRNIWNMNVQYDGEILLSGSEGPQAGGQTPLTMRVNGYLNVKSIPQFTGSVPEIPSDINSTFGIAYTFPSMVTLVEGGSTTVDSLGRVLVGGITSDNTFIVARFLSDGTLDPDFSNSDYDGIAESPELSTLSSGSFISLDSANNVYIGGISTDDTLIVAKFLTTGDLDITGFNASAVSPLVPGVAQSAVITDLVSGGYTTVDYLLNVIVGGMTSDHKLVVARFTTSGLADDGFGTSGVAKTDVISRLHSGGYVTTEQTSLVLEDANKIYVGATTYDEILLVARFTSAGILDAGTWNSAGATSGIAATDTIANLSNGGPVALDSNRNALVGGFTTDKFFVVAKFTVTGVYDPEFSSDGIAFSNALASLNSCTSIAVDNNNDVLLGGVSTAYDGISKSMISARWTSTGNIDSSFTTTGIATTGTITDLVSGGFLAVNILNNVFTGGYATTRLVVGSLNSGAELFINNPRNLPTLASALFLYGNNSSRFRSYLGVDLFAQMITDGTVKSAVIDRINIALDEYLAVYRNQPNMNLAASTAPGWNSDFAVLEILLSEDYPDSAAEIADFFIEFNRRRLAVHNVLAVYSRR